MIDELFRYINIIENDGIETEEIYALCNVLYKVIGELKDYDKKIDILNYKINWLEAIIKGQENTILKLKAQNGNHLNNSPILCEPSVECFE